MSDTQTPDGPKVNVKSYTNSEQIKKARNLALASVGAIVLVLGLAAWLSWTPGLKLDAPSPAALTPASCTVFVHAPGLGRNLRYLRGKEVVQAFEKSGAPQKFIEILFQTDPESAKQKAGGMSGQVLGFVAQDVSVASCPATDGRPGQPGELLVVSELGFAQRVMFNLGKGRLKKADTQEGLAVRTLTRGGRTFHIAVAGGFLIASTERALLNRALDLGMEKDDRSVAAADFYRKASAHAGHGRMVAEWFAPRGAFKSSLTHAKLDYGRITAGGGGVTLEFVSRAHSEEDEAGAASMDPAGMLPASVSMLTITGSFRRVWQDLLLGKAMDPEEAETFMQELYGFGLEELAKYFDGNAAIAVDGVFKAGDDTPVPSLVFVYKAKDREKAAEKVHEILRESIKDDYVDRKVLRNQMEYIVFKNDYDKTAVIAPSYAVVEDTVFFTLTDTEMDRVLDAAAGKAPALSGTHAYKAFFPGKDGEQDAFLLMQGKELSDQAVDYFTWFGDISSPELARALQQAVVPAVRMLEYSAGGAGQLRYEDGLLHGTITFFNKTR